MMKYLLIALAISATAISAQDSLTDEFLDTRMQLPCIPKPCEPVCKSVTKYMEYGAYKMPYQENVCEPDTKCLAEKAACIAKLEAAMKAAEAAEKDMIEKAKLANAAKATKAQKDAAAANAASISAASSSKNKN